MKNTYLILFGESYFKEKRFVFQTNGPSESIGRAVVDAALRKAKEKLTLPQGISSALESAILAIARILQTSGNLIDSSSGLLMSGIDWAKLGFDRIKKAAGREDPPRDYLDEYSLVKAYFVEFDPALVNGAPRSNEDIEIIRNYPEIKKIVDAHMFVNFFNFKMREVEKFYAPARREEQKVKDRLNLVRTNQGNDEDMEKYGMLTLNIEGLEERLKNSPSRDPATLNGIRSQILAKKTERAPLERKLSYAQNWAMPQMVSVEFPPNSTPIEYQSRFEPATSKLARYNLPDLYNKLGSELEHMLPLMERYEEEARRQAYVRDEQALILGNRLAGQNKDEKFLDKVRGIIDVEFTRLSGEHDTSVKGIEASFRREQGLPDAAGITNDLPPTILLNPLIDHSQPVPTLKSTLGTGI